MDVIDIHKSLWWPCFDHLASFCETWILRPPYIYQVTFFIQDISPRHLSHPEALCIIILCPCLTILALREELDIVSKYIRALMQFFIWLQKTVALSGKGFTASWNKFHVSLKENFASAYPSEMYIPFISTYFFVNSSAYE